MSLMSLALAAGFFTTSTTWEALSLNYQNIHKYILVTKSISVFTLKEYLLSSLSTNFYQQPILHSNNSYNNRGSDTGSIHATFIVTMKERQEQHWLYKFSVELYQNDCLTIIYI